MGTSVKANTHLYVDEQNRVRVVFEYVDGTTRTLKTDSGEPCVSATAGDLGRVRIVKSGAVLRHVAESLSALR